jgi:hypothetical protein
MAAYASVLQQALSGHISRLRLSLIDPAHKRVTVVIRDVRSHGPAAVFTDEIDVAKATEAFQLASEVAK